MSNITQTKSIKSFFDGDAVKGKFNELLGKRSSQFITSVLQVVNSNTLLQKADPTTIYTAACTAAVLDLPINQNLGFAYIVPYKGQAQFQMGYKGFIQLAIRSGQYRTISACPIYEGQLSEENPLMGFVFDFKSKKSDKVIGYAAYFEMLNGFYKSDFWSVEKTESHAKRYSQSYKSGSGVWKDDFDAMGMKTVLKNLLSKYGLLSVEMQTAVERDSSVIAEDGTVEYVDHVELDENEENELILGELSARYSGLEKRLSKDHKALAVRILENKESANYQKLSDLFDSYSLPPQE